VATTPGTAKVTIATRFRQHLGQVEMEGGLEEEAGQKDREEELFGQVWRREEAERAEHDASEDEGHRVRQAPSACGDRDRGGHDEQEDECGFRLHGPIDVWGRVGGAASPRLRCGTRDDPCCVRGVPPVRLGRAQQTLAPIRHRPCGERKSRPAAPDRCLRLDASPPL
jgi:hypothetical protein